MCNNENSEKTINPQFRVHLAEKLANSSSNKSVFLGNPQCPKSPTESLVVANNPTAAARNISGHQNLAIPPSAGVMSSMLGNAVVPPGLLPPLDHYRLQLYNYAMVERLRCSQYPGPLPICPPGYPAAAAVNGPYGPRFALSMSLFHNRVFTPEEPKPQHSYIGLIAMAILSSPESKLVLSDIYQHILDNYPYFRSRGPGWRNSIRHNLSLNDCFIKAGRSANGKGHYWAVHPANLEDFKKGDFRRRKAQRKVRKHMGLAVDDEGTDSPSPPPLAVTPPPHPQAVVGPAFCPTSWAAAAAVASGRPTAGVMANIYSQSRKRQFDVASLLAPDDESSNQRFAARQQLEAQSFDTEQHFLKAPLCKRAALTNSSDVDEDIDVVASDVEDNSCPTKGHHNPTTDLISHHEQQQQQQQIIDPQDDESQILEVQPDSGQSMQPENYQLQQEDTTAESPISQQDEDIHQTPPSPNTWQGLIQQWPNNFNPLGVGAAMDPRILGRYYGQYMAAAAAQQAAARHSAVVVGNFLNGGTTNATNINSSSSGGGGSRNATPPGIGNSVVSDAAEFQQQQQQQQHHHHHHQPNELSLPTNDC